jgi:hypothetical protein
VDSGVDMPVGRSSDNVSISIYIELSLEKLPTHTNNACARYESIKTR